MFEDFVKTESAGGIFLFAAAVLAIVVANTGLAPYYDGLWETHVQFRIGSFDLDKSLHHWVNDGLMVLFFFVVGLEVKREILDGALSSVEQAALPVIAAIGGMIAPAILFVLINIASPENLNGWAIPAATDIAFALGVMALLGSRVAPALKVLLLAIAIIDDIGAIAIIAVFYTADLNTTALILAAVGIAVLVVLNLRRTTSITPYAIVGAFVWLCILKSGVHATLAGVMVAFAIPLTGRDGSSPLKHLEHVLHPWVAFAVMPIFAFANAGIDLAGLGLGDLLAPLPLGIAVGLIVGKQLGVFGFAYGGVRLGITRLPDGLSWREVYGLACTAGIGFTMSLFIGTLAFTDPEQMDAVKLGVLLGSLVSGVLGAVFLSAVSRRAVVPAAPANAAPAAEPIPAQAKTAPPSEDFEERLPGGFAEGLPEDFGAPEEGPAAERDGDEDTVVPGDR
ncbi:MAG: Na+/H+ antiporter NhaA [Rhodospirillaceae bacterium]|nr:Na+/H+ antiporter NhaA [Rhodospirillaceae bacterium]MCA8932346.1 Na+/H+ antiporter NhaA [Rhodospirillaceae bacterium]